VSLSELAGVRDVHRLYVQLLYKCNFACRHCFHGEKLKDVSSIPFEQYTKLVDYFVDRHNTEDLVLLGGEPFLYLGIQDAIGYADSRGLSVEICTNGHHFTQRHIRAAGAGIHHLRVSVDGLEAAHDQIRQRGSFRYAMATLRVAAEHSRKASVTTTVTSVNVGDIFELAEIAAQNGATEIKLHQLRLVGNAALHPELCISNDDPRLNVLRKQIEEANWPFHVIFDADVVGGVAGEPPQAKHGVDLERIELDPEYGLTMSCKAVGRNAHSFVWDPMAQGVIKRLSDLSETVLGIPQVTYLGGGGR
jgi:Fe-coproporphyrin III synthase